MDRSHAINEMSAPVIDRNDAVTGHIISTTIGGKNGEPKQTVSYMAERVVGTGSFGIVFQAKCIETGETVAIKKVLQDRRYKNRELQLMRTMDHPNVRGEANISYICSRFYRAPELIFGATEYTTSIDIWSAGCVLAELLLGQPLFPGENAVGQLVEIIKVLGTPTREEIRCMNPNYTDFRFPQIKAHPWHKVFQKRMPPEAIDLASRLLQYSPNLRCTALEAIAHPFFDELREPSARLPNGRPMPPLFNFKQELSGASPDLVSKLIPDHVKRQMGLQFFASYEGMT
ncbi:hypothetical protein DH2020_032740 [Rehmannia glutinosa]|uniref:non-specific serine/threonine protein kinase n=1 Tax=Rehmannia glutinosa TaxID=99300 RepID=A0ABR0VH93_REHGL